jgi:diguanylate cyclase (GGDEF)-like protein
MPELSYLLQFELIIGLCFSFFILIIVYFIDKDKNSLRLFGFSFMFIFLSGISSIFIRSTEKLLFLEKASLTFFFLSLILILKINKPKKWFKVYRWITILVSGLLFLQFNFTKFGTPPSWVNLLFFFILIIQCSIIMYLTRNTKQYMNFFWSSLTFITAFMVSNLPQSSLRIFTTILITIAYGNLLAYFVGNTMKKLIEENEKLKKKFAEIDQNVEFEVKKRTIEIENSNKKLVNISRTDALTGAYNKIAILNLIEKHIADSRMKEFCIFMFDIDYFKKVNDTYGHLTGDKCIKTLSHLALSSIRDFDSLGRYGGDEFIILLPSTNLTHAKYVGERFRKKVEETNNPHFTISIGVAHYPDDGKTLKELITAADEGLYRSKDKGRNAISHQTMF